MKHLFRATACLYFLIWTTHLVIGTMALRGFFGDGALAFLLHLSQSYVFGVPSSWVHLFQVGFPRDGQLLLNALGLQAALAVHVTAADTLKYVFVFWQYALPGFLYVTLFAVLWRKGKTAWAIFPLASWAILSVPMDWGAVNSTRWAVPVFWMHFMLVLLAKPKIRPWPVAAALVLGALLWAGMYESVILHCVLCLIVAGLLWWREGNRAPMLYALVSVPGACRAFVSLTSSEHMLAPNGFNGFMLPRVATQSYYLFIILALVILLLLGRTGRMLPKYFYGILLFLLAVVGVNVFLDPLPNIWVQTEMRYDYVALASGVMAVAALWRILKFKPDKIALPAASLILAVGAVLWFIQIQQTFDWQQCRTDYQNNKPNTVIVTDRGLASLLKPDSRIGIIDPMLYNGCLWGWTTPWADILLKRDGQISQWIWLDFWQNFRFVEKNGAVVLRTNNGSLTTPTFQPDAADFPLKTMLYDMTPLYTRVGLGDLIQRTHCLDPDMSGEYWHNYLVGLDDAGRRLMSVCPRN